MPYDLIGVIAVISLFVITSPIYMQRRKLWRMADEDLKRIDRSEWKKQLRSNAYIQLFSRVGWGIFLLSGFIVNFREAVAPGFNWLTIFLFVLGVSFIVGGILGFRLELRNLSETE